MPRVARVNAPSELLPQVAALLASAGRGDTVREMQSLAHGGNNRAWKATAGDCEYAVKQYFRHAGDSRDRLRAEFDFSRYAHALAPGIVPEPVACDQESGLAVYAFVAGTPFVRGCVGRAEVDAAASFFSRLNGEARFSSGKNLPEASEACFSIAAHLELVGGRLARLEEPVSLTGGEAAGLLAEISRYWRHLEERITGAARERRIVVDTPLAPQQRCISPSDFGFHNALRRRSGGICFLDFEYAGWDDPAKMVGDFFAQLAVPVPGEHFERFANAAFGGLQDAGALIERARLLRPVYQIKWCCIALNVFLPVHMARRKFADPALDEGTLKRAQLAKARTLFQSIEQTDHGLH